MSSDNSPRFTPEEPRPLFATDSPHSPQPGTRQSPGARLRSMYSGGFSRFAPVFILLAIMWIVEIVDAILPADLDAFGLQSWNPIALYGIVTGPLLHAGFGHLLANTFPFLILGLFIAAEGARRFWLVTVISAVVSGLGAWLTTFPGHYIVGASGIVFGYFGYLAVRTWFTEDVLRRIIYFAIGLFVFVTYGASLVFGLFPQANGVSW
ncbi:rhomboid family intramembrane serine protease, partial [Burkholderia multivorans]